MGAPASLCPRARAAYGRLTRTSCLSKANVFVKKSASVLRWLDWVLPSGPIAYCQWYQRVVANPWLHQRVVANPWLHGISGLLQILGPWLHQRVVANPWLPKDSSEHGDEEGADDAHLSGTSVDSSVDGDSEADAAAELAMACGGVEGGAPRTDEDDPGEQPPEPPAAAAPPLEGAPAAAKPLAPAAPPPAGGGEGAPLEHAAPLWVPPPPAAPVPPPPPPPAGEADLPRTITYFLPGSRHNSKITWYKGTRNIEISCRNPEHGASSCRLTRTTKAYSGKGGGHWLQGRPLGFAVAWLQGGCEADGGSELHQSFEPSREDRRIARQTLKESAQGRLLLSTERAKFDGEDSEPDM